MRPSTRQTHFRIDAASIDEYWCENIGDGDPAVQEARKALRDRTPIEVHVRYSAMCVLNKAAAVLLPWVDFSLQNTSISPVVTSFELRLVHNIARGTVGGKQSLPPLLHRPQPQPQPQLQYRLCGPCFSSSTHRPRAC